MDELIISVSGLRGIVGQSLTDEIAQRYVAAFAAELPAGPILITRDGRASGPSLVRAIEAALGACERETLNAGITATPTTGVLVQQHNAAGAVQVSASHNPAEYNGIKLLGGDGRVLPAVQGARVRERFRDTRPPKPSKLSSGNAKTIADTASEHLRRVLALVNVERIRSWKFRVLLDSNHGAGSVAGLPLLERLGCDVVTLGGTPDGKFEHIPEPTAQNLAGVLAQVSKVGAAVGFCQDPDADRLALIDECGRYIGEEYTLALAVDHVLAARPGPVVTNGSTSRMTRDLAEKYRVPFYSAAVGEANVVDRMLEVGAVLGGEGNGGVIEPRVVLVRDSIVAMAYVLDALAARGGTLSQWADSLPRYEIVKNKFAMAAEKLPKVLAALEHHFSDADIDRLDGLRLDWPDRWLQVRGSNTEPIVRAIAEARGAGEAEALCAAVGEVIAAVE